jgi:hypothetical protein
MDPPIFSLSTRQRAVVIFIALPLHLQGKTVAYPGIFFGGGSTFQLRTKGTEKGDLGQ